VRAQGYVTDIITELTEKWLDGRDRSKPFCLIVGEKATHREWLPDSTDLGAYDDKEFPLPASFHDLYQGRRAAADQDMTIGKTVRLKEDLKVHVDYGSGFRVSCRMKSTEDSGMEHLGFRCVCDK
jgi:hypothetical protein